MRTAGRGTVRSDIHCYHSVTTSAAESRGKQGNDRPLNRQIESYSDRKPANVDLGDGGGPLLDRSDSFAVWPAFEWYTMVIVGTERSSL